MDIKKIIKEEIDDLSWMDDVQPIPEGIMEALNKTSGHYKVWLGNIPKEQQLIILDYLINEIKNRGISHTNSFYTIKSSVKNDISITSLFFYIRSGGNIELSMMAVYPYHKKDFEDRFDYCEEYFNNESTAEEL